MTNKYLNVEVSNINFKVPGNDQIVCELVLLDEGNNTVSLTVSKLDTMVELLKVFPEGTAHTKFIRLVLTDKNEVIGFAHITKNIQFIASKDEEPEQKELL